MPTAVSTLVQFGDEDQVALIDPSDISGIVQNRSVRSRYLRPTRIYLHSGRTLTVSQPLQVAVATYRNALGITEPDAPAPSGDGRAQPEPGDFADASIEDDE